MMSVQRPWMMILWCTFAVLIFQIGMAGEPVRRPNIVLIMADDVGCDAIGCYGGETYPTPNIDRLAATGMRFTHCYSMPSCHPTRICLTTGRYPRRVGNPRWGSFPRSEESSTIAQVVKSAGYATAVAGKWQLALLSNDLRQPHRMGFEQYSVFGWHEGPRYYQPLIFQNGQIRADVRDRFGPDVYCEFLIDFIKRNREQPFFAYFPMALCHDVTDDLQEPVPYGPRGRYDSYAEMAHDMDRVVGRLTTAIDELGLSEKTLILFTGDNGTAARSIIRVENGQYIREPVFTVYQGKRVQGEKTQLTNGGTNVPLIATWPRTINAGQVVTDLVDFSDFLPTLAELAGARRPDQVTLDGHSFAGRLTAGKPTTRRWAYSEARDRYWVRTQRWKLYNTGQLFDMDKDPDETTPIDPDHVPGPAVADFQQLKSALRQVASFTQ